MNERVPDSSGLPLRAMVMVLLFLGVVFLLLGLQAAGSSSGDEVGTSTTSSSEASSTEASTSAEETSEEPSPEPDPQGAPEVRVYNISGQDGAAGAVRDQLVASDVEVAETGDMAPEVAPVSVNTVFFPEDSDAARSLAEQIGEILQAPVEVRGPNLADQPPGIIVVVTG